LLGGKKVVGVVGWMGGGVDQRRPARGALNGLLIAGT